MNNICIAQELSVNVDVFGVKDGLSDSAIFAVRQDDRGLVWLARGNGVDRFDGTDY